MERTETVADAWTRRASAASGVDFAMMYAAHDAFNRDLARLIDAVREDRVHTPAVAGTWTLFTSQLHLHHATEDTSLWPALRAAIVHPREVAVLDAMEAEHAGLDPLIETADDAVRRRDRAALADGLNRLATSLSAHMRHEEDEALPLVARRIGQGGWERFGQQIRRTQGIRGAAVYLPWVLDGATEPVRRAVLGQLPPPARVVYRSLWAPRYRKGDRL